MRTNRPEMQYFSAAAVEAALPSIEDGIRLAGYALSRVGREAQNPGKGIVYPRPDASFAYAMPAYDAGVDQSGDALGMKWVAGYPSNARLGLPAISSLVVLNDPVSLEPIAIFEGSRITARRTAAVSAVAIRLLAPSITGRAAVVAVIGAGVQGRSHLEPLGHVLPGLQLRTYDRHADRAAELARAGRATPGIDRAEAAGSPESAVEGADVVITAASFGSPAQVMTPDWLAEDVLVVAVDYDTYASAELAASASLFLVDELDGYERVKDGGHFRGYPAPGGTIGDAILAGTRWPGGRVLVSHLGIGLTDVLFAAAVHRRAVELGLGVDLPA